MPTEIAALLLHYTCAAIVVVSAAGLALAGSRKAAVALLGPLGIGVALLAAGFLVVEGWRIYETAEEGGLFQKLALRKALLGSRAWVLYLRLAGAGVAQILWSRSVRKKLPACLAAGMAGDAAFWAGNFDG